MDGGIVIFLWPVLSSSRIMCAIPPAIPPIASSTPATRISIPASICRVSERQVETVSPPHAAQLAVLELVPAAPFLHSPGLGPLSAVPNAGVCQAPQY